MEKKFYAIKNKNNDIRMKSSSGGVFYEIAKWVINNNGIVYGAIYDDKNNVVHYRATKKDELTAFYGSKYVQSNIGKSYEYAKQDLENGRIVLFSGTPCQINAVKNLTKNINSGKLYLVDIICHGTPQIKYYNDYKRYIEKKYKSNIKNINMRYKNKKRYIKNIQSNNVSDNIIEPHIMRFEFENKSVIEEGSQFNEYYQLFDYFLNPGCFKCPFSNLNRNSDITIGDFHTFKTNLKEFNDGNGVSLVILNSDKGETLLNNIKDNFYIIEKKEKECYQPAIYGPTDKPDNYDQFCIDYEKYGFEYVIKKYRNKGLKYNIKKVLYKLGIYDILKKLKK